MIYIEPLPQDIRDQIQRDIDARRHDLYAVQYYFDDIEYERKILAECRTGWNINYKPPTLTGHPPKPLRRLWLPPPSTINRSNKRADSIFSRT